MRSWQGIDVDLLLLVRKRHKLAHPLLELVKSEAEVGDILLEDLARVDRLEKVDYFVEREVEDALKDLEEASEEDVEES